MARLATLEPAATQRAIRFLVLAGEPGGCVGVDLGSGAFVRAQHPPSGNSAVAPFDVAVASVATLTYPADHTRPETVELEQPPARDGHLSPRRANRWLRPLLHPRRAPLLGFAGPAAPYWTLRGDQPSVSLIELARASRGPLATRDPAGGFRCVFWWRDARIDLPLGDDRLVASLDELGRQRYGRTDLHRVLGWRPRRVLVVLTPPSQGYCRKVVAALLPR